MEISTRFDNFSGNAEESLTFLKQIGVDAVSFGLSSGFGYRGGPVHQSSSPGNPDELISNMKTAVSRVKKAGLKATETAFDITDALLGKPGGEKELETGTALIKAAGENGITHIWVRPLGIRQGPMGVPGRYNRTHRGGYMASAFSLKLMREELNKRDPNSQWAHHFENSLSIEEYFDNYMDALRRLVPVAEEAGVKLMLHTDDPPVADTDNLLPGIVSPLMINRIFEAVPSKNLGLLFCVGTRYETGVDIYDQIRLFGNMGKIFAVHLRNVRGTVPSAGEYEEVMLDEGDMDMFKILKALKAIGYDGTLSPDHPTIFVGDEKQRATAAWDTGYIRALLQALKSEECD